MQAQSTQNKINSKIKDLISQLNDPHNKKIAILISFLIIIFELILSILIIWKIPYTEIDWEAYMEEVLGFIQGERNYLNLRGGTGPLVYPAGFVHLYSAIYYITNSGNIFIGQIIFYILYILTQILILYIYIQGELLPPWALPLLALSKRMHSIYMLRMFNDCFSSFFAYLAIAFLMNQKWIFSVILFSLGVSIKMNVLLYVPSVVFVAVKNSNFGEVFLGGILGGLLQGILAFPFLIKFPQEYFSRAFEFSRVFMYKWTVNFKFIDEELFVSKQLALFLLIAHLFLLGVFMVKKWNVFGEDFSTILSDFFNQQNNEQTRKKLSKQQVLFIVFSGNFIGILCARSLHYQFYSWYFHTVPYLLWCTPFPNFVRILIWFFIEIVWNIYPPNYYSSLLLLFCHLMIIFGMWFWNPPKENKQKNN